MLPPAPPEIDWNSAVAFRWRKRQGRGFLQPVPNLSPLSLDDLCNIELQKGVIEQNTRQFVRKSPANNGKAMTVISTFLSPSRTTKAALRRPVFGCGCQPAGVT